MPRLSLVTLADVPVLPCPYCGRIIAADAAWAVAAAARWGWCGVKLLADEDDALIGVLLVGPTENTGQAMVMSCWVAPDQVGLGHGRRLVEGLASNLLKRGVRMIYAQGRRNQLHCSTPPRDFLRAVGFVRGLDERLWHLDLDRTVTDRNPVFEVLERFVGSLRPAPPEPAGGAVRSHGQ